MLLEADRWAEVECIPRYIFLFGPLALPNADLPDTGRGEDKPELSAAERAAEQRPAPVPQNLRQPESFPVPQAEQQTGTAKPVLVLGADSRTEKPVPCTYRCGWNDRHTPELSLTVASTNNR